MTIPLTKLKKGLKARIIELSGGKMVSHKLSSMGLRPGSPIVKLSSFAMKGPVTVRSGHTVVALGHGMAENILVEVLTEISPKA